VKLILSGEGPTDIGDWGYGETGGKRFRPGPMTYFIDTLLRPSLGHSALEADGGRGDIVSFIDEGELARRERCDPLVLRGKKAGKGSGFFTKNAQALGLIAKNEAERMEVPVIAVLFRDSDGTQSRDEWREKQASMSRRFERVGFERGVPMIPHPKSEAWLLCALAKGYHSCASLESRSGNDRSAHSLKAELEALLEEPATREIVNGLICKGSIDPHRIDMPSFNVFKERLLEAVPRE